MLAVRVTVRLFGVNNSFRQAKPVLCMLRRQALIGFAPLGDGLIRIDGMHAIIRSAVKHNHRHAPPILARETAAHRFEGKLSLPDGIGPPRVIAASASEKLVAALNSAP